MQSAGLFAIQQNSKALVWGNNDNNQADEAYGDDNHNNDGTSTDSEKTDPDHFLSFEVAKTKDLRR